MSLPDLPRARFSLPVRGLASSAIVLSRQVTWRTLHPADRDRFLPHARPERLRRVPYTSPDGVSGALLHLPATPGSKGEPVLLSHALGLAPAAYRCGNDQTLAGALSAAGFSVYLLLHRGDDTVVTPAGVPRDFDAILERDVPPALDAVVAHSGFPLVHWVGHGLGGQLGLVTAARRERLATVVALGAPVQFQRPRTEFRTLGLLRKLLPEGLSVPTHWLARAALPVMGHAEWMGGVRGEQMRAALEYGTAAVPYPLIEQLLTWVEQGSLCSRGGLVDYTALFGQAQCPVLVAYGKRSSWAGEAAVTPTVHRWGHPDALVLSVDGRSADLVGGQASLASLVEWLSDRRERCWGTAHQEARRA